MDLPPPVNRSAYDKLNKKIHKAVKEVSIEVMKDACDEVRVVLLMLIRPFCLILMLILLTLSIHLFFVMMTIRLFRVMPMSIHLFSLMLILLIYISVSCDGTWHRRGFSSLNGTVACISMDTGKVLYRNY